ncbi:MAG: hypothetical protein ABF968_13240, partial [Acetobacter sp.]|uniref:hypothetical protein n=1 Tax=Acetobacter sp. TaxID=440 RepID=UPI0039EC7DD5
MPRINEYPIGGTTLIGDVEALNAEPEHINIGLSWTLAGGLLYVEAGPRAGANMANPLGICEEIQRHLDSGGISFDWYYSDDSYNTFKVTPRSIEHDIDSN